MEWTCPGSNTCDVMNLRQTHFCPELERDFILPSLTGAVAVGACSNRNSFCTVIQWIWSIIQIFHPPPPSPALLQLAIVLTDSCSLAISLCVWVVACIHVGVHACIMYFVHACMCACQECVCVHASMCVRMLGTLFWAEKNQCIIASCKHSLFVMTIWSLCLWSVLVSKCRLKMTVHSMYVTLNFDTESYSLHTQKLRFRLIFVIYI